MSIEENGEREKKKAEAFPNSEEHPPHIPDFYRDKKKKKVLDIFLGFGLIISEIIVIFIWNNSLDDFGIIAIIILVIPITVIVDIILIVQFFKKNRRYIAHGILYAFAILILFGIIFFMIIPAAMYLIRLNP